jgi:hypothetical protein
VATLIEAFSAVLLSFGSYLILRTLWKLDVPPVRAVARRQPRPEPAPEIRRAA